MSEKLLLTEKQKLMAVALSTQVTFLPASYDKRFCRGLPIDSTYSEKQIDYLEKCFTKYRRQIKDYDMIINML
jgi:hypothetical protein